MSYPNPFDKAKAKVDGRQNLGGNIFIHGKDVTIGCIPIGDSAIEEVFALTAHAGKENIKIIIAPYDLRNHQTQPNISSINWEDDLYALIKKELEEALGGLE